MSIDDIWIYLLLVLLCTQRVGFQCKLPTRLQNDQENLRWHFRKPSWQFTLEADLLSAEQDRKKIDPDIVDGHQGKQGYEASITAALAKLGGTDRTLLMFLKL